MWCWILGLTVELTCFKNAVFWDVVLCMSCENQLSEEHVTSIYQPTANTLPCSQILSTLKMEATPFSETSVFTRLTQCHIPEYGIFIVAAMKTSNPTCFKSSYLRNRMLGSFLRLQNPKMWLQMGPNGTGRQNRTLSAANSGTLSGVSS
jgi:hypothetical protein